jgi:hypothetical protein
MPGEPAVAAAPGLPGVGRATGGWRAVCLSGLLAALSADAAAPPAALLHAGWTEPAHVLEAGIDLRAKLDTGAEHSSLHAEDLARFERGGSDWVRFTLRGADGRRVTVERPLTREVKIKRHAAPAQHRPVVRLTLCLGGVQREVDVNLVDRRDFDLPLLIGRSFLRGLVLVDAAREQLTDAACRQQPGG